MQNLNGNGEAWFVRFQALLDEQTDWPADYLFKFIVPAKELDEMKEVLGEEVKVRSSSRGNYMSVTANRYMASSREVIAVYKAAGEVDGVIAL